MSFELNKFLKIHFTFLEICIIIVITKYTFKGKKK